MPNLRHTYEIHTSQPAKGAVMDAKIKEQIDTQSGTYHYNIIRRAIDEIDASPAPLSLEDLAIRMNMSPSHFQRVFSRWVGVSPKKFQQFLTLGHAKTLLAERFSTLETSHLTGLSGQGRLHDLFLSWEAMTPGAYAIGGKGLEISWGVFDSPFGPALVMGTTKGICGLAFTAENGQTESLQDMCARWPNATFINDASHLEPWVAQAFQGRGSTQLHLIGAPFQIKVWEALLAIPSGHVTTYSQIAQKVGNPKAVRAVGTAVGKNPIGWLIPCHRALRKSGALGGYHWGLPVKRALLAHETAQLEASNSQISPNGLAKLR
jgi:AraC family transcriptional regulator of adaptative response/methylated-DNA-[protein]-cysteine methyltransferase